MRSMLKHRGYHGTMEHSDEDECFFRKVFEVNDLILFEGDSVKALRTDSHEAMDNYLESCKERGKESDKFYKGSFSIRIAPELHKKAALAAEQRRQTLNSFMKNAICMMVSTIL